MMRNFGCVQRVAPVALLCLLAVLPLWAFGGEGDTPLRASHENLPQGAFTDDLGIFVPVSVSHPGRRYPATEEFPSGPAVGERLPEFRLPDQEGVMVDFHSDRAKGKAVVVFYRSTVW